MATFVPTKSFTGYPDGNHRNPVRFLEGVESVPVPDEFARSIYENGLAAYVPKKSDVDPPRTTAATKSRRSGKAAGRSSQT